MLAAFYIIKNGLYKTMYHVPVEIPDLIYNIFFYQFW